MRMFVWIAIVIAIIGCGADNPTTEDVPTEPKTEVAISVEPTDTDVELPSPEPVDEILPGDDVRDVQVAAFHQMKASLGLIRDLKDVMKRKHIVNFIKDAKAHAKENCGKAEVELLPGLDLIFASRLLRDEFKELLQGGWTDRRVDNNPPTWIVIQDPVFQVGEKLYFFIELQPYDECSLR